MPKKHALDIKDNNSVIINVYDGAFYNTNNALFVPPIETIKELGDAELIDDEGPKIFWPLRNLDFPSPMNIYNPSEFTVFEGAQTWENIPQFAIVTGPNGSGKSQLLNYIRNSLKENWLIYIRPSEDFSSFSRPQMQVDTTHRLRDETARSALLDKIEQYYDGHVKTKIKEPFEKMIIDDIDRKLKSGKIERGVINQEYIEKIALRLIPFDKNKLEISRPLTLLLNVATQHKKRKDLLFERISKIESADELFTYYSQASFSPEKLDMSQFFKKLRIDKNFKEECFSSYVTSILPRSPIEDINEILKKFGFNYIVQVNEREEKILLKEENSGREIELHKLSSGQIMILNMMGWLYYVNGLSDEPQDDFRAVENKIKLMLLDEPDKHLDPKLCKLFFEIVYEEFVKRQGIQVIMTTHRIDTVMLAPDDCLYLIENKNAIRSIKSVHKVHAMFRLSFNLRDLLDYHHKVYTESTDDAQFYEAAYFSIKKLCSALRDKKIVTSNKAGDWNGYGLLSNRYQMSFYSVSERDSMGNSKTDGGSIKVKSSMMRDFTALENLSRESSAPASHRGELSSLWKRTRNIFRDIEFYKSYGVLDNDYGSDHGLDEQCGIVLKKERAFRKPIGSNR